MSLKYMGEGYSPIRETRANCSGCGWKVSATTGTCANRRCKLKR